MPEHPGPLVPKLNTTMFAEWVRKVIEASDDEVAVGIAVFRRGDEVWFEANALGHTFTVSVKG